MLTGSGVEAQSLDEGAETAVVAIEEDGEAIGDATEGRGVKDISLEGSITESYWSNGFKSSTANRASELKLRDITETKAGETFVAPPVVIERGLGFRVIESVTRAQSANEILKTNRYTIHGEFAGEETLPGVRTAVIQPQTVVERGEHFKTIQTITEFLGYDGVKTLKTNRFVEFDSEEEFSRATNKATVLEWSAHQKRVRKDVLQRDGQGRLQVSTSSYIELGTGIAYQDEKGDWHDSVPEFELLPDGSAVANHTQHKVLLKANPNAEDPVQVTLPDGTVLKSRVLGLAYFDRSSGQSVVIATLKDSEGELNAAKNEVIFPDAFQGISASVRYIQSYGGIEQDIILHEQPAPPQDYDESLNPDTSELEVITEFFPSKEPEVTRNLLQKGDPLITQGMAEPDLSDELIDFPGMRIGPGRAFGLDDAQGASNAASVAVRKRWQNIDGRTVLFEAVAYPELRVISEKLPVATPGEDKPRASLGRKLPVRQMANITSDSRRVRLAQLDRTKPGVVLDYALIGTISDLTLSAGTYLLKGTVSVANSTVIQGGAVVKAAPGSSLTLSQTVTCQTSSSSKAYFVSVNDNTVGATIVPGAPVGTYATAAINLYNVGGGTTISYLEIRNAAIGIDVYSPGVVNVNNCRVVDCPTAIRTYYSTVNSTDLSLCGCTSEWINSGFSVYTPNNTTALCNYECPGDDDGNAAPRATSMTLGTPVAGNINCAGDEDFFAVNIQGLTDVVVVTTGGTDTYGHLLNSNGYEIASDDNSGTSPNFRIASRLDAGTYYIRVHRASPVGSGAYQLLVTVKSLVSNISSFGGIRNDYPGWVGFRFTVGSTPMVVSQLGRWILSGNNQSHTLQLFDSGGNLLSGGSAILNTSNQVANQFAYANLASPLTLGANTTYAVMSRENQNGDQWYDLGGTAISLDPAASNPTAAYSSSPPPLVVATSDRSYGPVDLRFSITSPPADDHGNDTANATSVALNSNVAGAFNYAGDEDFFRIVIGSSGYLTVYSTGMTDTYGHLLDASGNELSPPRRNDDNPYPNFSITRQLSAAGTYYVRVRSFSGGTGSYTFRADFSATPPPAVTTPVFNNIVFDSDHVTASAGATSQAGATVFYSTDGNDPDVTYSTVPPIVSSSSAITVKAKAYQAGYSPSAVTTLSPIATTSPVSFSPNGHGPIEYANGPLNVTISSQSSATVRYQIGASGSWNSANTGSGSSVVVTVDGIDNGNGTIQAYAYAVDKFRSTSSSRSFSFRLPQPTSTAVYSGSNYTSGTVTLANSVPGASIRYTTDGITPPTASSTLYSSSLTFSSATKVYARAYKTGYVPSGYISAWVNKLPAPVFATSSGVLTGNITLDNDTDVWILPNFGFNNVYGESKSTAGWSAGIYTNDVPNANHLGAFTAAGQITLASVANVQVSYGRTYSMGGWYKAIVPGTHDYGGVINYDSFGTFITAKDINGGYGVTTLIEPLVNGNTTAYLANEQIFSPAPGLWWANFFVPVTNFDRNSPITPGNQANALVDLYQQTTFPVVEASSLHATSVQPTNKSVTLSIPYSGPTLPIGTPIARRTSGGTYQYSLLGGQLIPTSWTRYSNSFSAMRAGTERVQTHALISRDGGVSEVTGLEFWEGQGNDRPNLYYTLNGSSSVYTSGISDPGPKKISLSGTTTINLGQRGTYYIDSPVGQRIIFFKVATPQIASTLNSPGTFVTNVASTVTVGAEIRYTSDGTEPTASSTLYTNGTSGVVIAAHLTTKWKAFKTNYTASDTVTQSGVSITDSDGDGLSDAWEMQNFGSLSRNGTGDFDGDGISDSWEYQLGTNPLQNDINQNVKRLNLDYDTVGRLKGVTGLRNETIDVDPENNVRSIQP